METRKRDKKNEEMIGKYALHFFLVIKMDVIHIGITPLTKEHI